MLRRKLDRDGAIWIETAPGSGYYRHGRGAGWSERTVARNVGPLIDLDSIPADTSAVAR